MWNWISARGFRAVHGSNLVYNTCWEDPRLDRVALQLGPEDRVLVITSAGCNTLDYALQAPAHVYAVDMNPRQNALLELKIAGIRSLPYERFFQMFGYGILPDAERLYRSHLRPLLSDSARAYWDRRIYFFSGNTQRRSFYFHGTSGVFAYLINQYVDRVANVRDAVHAILDASTVVEQSSIYYESLRDAIWTRPIRWAIGRDATLSLLGVPRPQRMQVERHYQAGIAQFVEECLDAVFGQLSLHDNYFWRVYLTGAYTADCCPEYLKRDNFERLQGGLVNRISVHTATIESFLRTHDAAISRFVLLDHMDWLSTAREPLLQREWQAIVDRAAPRARVLWRSGGLQVDYVDPLVVRIRGKRHRAGDLLRYDRELAAHLHQQDRVHTYGSFYIADLAAA
jgi:S-adenosylmethionine-diacylglycerol 3-amino-3-carboxypropyl transferase